MPPRFTEVAGWLILVRPPRLEPPRPILDRLTRSYATWLGLAVKDWGAEFRRVWKTVVFVARYCAQPIDDVERWPISKIARVATLTGEYLSEENKKGSTPRNMSPRSGAW